MSGDRLRALKRRRVIAATAGLVGLAGCSGGDGGSGDDGGDGGSGGDGGEGDSGGDGLYEGGEFTCADVGEASFTQYDAAGTALLFDFEYPDVFDTVNDSGSPAQGVTFIRRFGGDESYTEDQLVLQVDQLSGVTGRGRDRSDINTDSEAVTEVEFGERTAYAGPSIAGDPGPNEAIYRANVPHEVDGDIRYFTGQIQLSISIQTADGNVDAPEDCATTLEETGRAVAESVVPNSETAFDEVREE